MSKALLIVFVKNIQLGKVKTRLAKTIGDQAAFEVYKELVAITEKETSSVEDVDRHIYFSNQIIESKWKDDLKFVQIGENLGDRMRNAFLKGFELGYDKIIGVGSDLPELKADLISKGFAVLDSNKTVFGPANDGGYFLLGMNEFFPMIFKNKPWSKENLFKTTIDELEENLVSVGLLKHLNDVDTIEDLKASSLATKFKHYI